MAGVCTRLRSIAVPTLLWFVGAYGADLPALPTMVNGGDGEAMPVTSSDFPGPTLPPVPDRDNDPTYVTCDALPDRFSKGRSSLTDYIVSEERDEIWTLVDESHIADPTVRMWCQGSSEIYAAQR